MTKKAIIPSVLLIMICLTLSSFLIIEQKHRNIDKDNVQAKANLTKFHKTKPVTAISKELTEKVTIGAIGDILIHKSVYEDAYKGGHYIFDPMFSGVKQLMEQPDILTANEESLAAGSELGLSGYPCFNSPHEVEDALMHSGVDIVSTANNHALDKGERGIQAELQYLDHLGLPHVGTSLDEQDREKLRILDKNGIKVAFLSYTYGTNGIPVPKGKEYLVNIINRDAMKAEIQRARKQADVVVMSIHWGIEYQRLPNMEQKDLAQFLADQGVDIIFGSHPHVLQPMQWLTAADGRKVFVVYSLGNFISGQTNDYKDIGGLASVEISKQVTDKGTTIQLANPVFYPTFVSSQNLKNFRVVPLQKAASFGLVNAQAKYNEIEQYMKQWLR